MNRRFDALEREMVDFRADIGKLRSELRSEMAAGFGALEASIEARDFRLDEHGRRLTELEQRRT
jgi:hypothetical protein